MRYLLLALALPLAACGFNCSFPDYETVEAFQVLRTTPEASDTLTVVFDDERYFDYLLRDIWVRVGAQTPSLSETGETTLSLSLEYSGHGAETVPPLAAESRGDTVYVNLSEVFQLAEATPCPARDGIVQPVCSPGEEVYRVFVEGAEAPEDVRAIQYLSRDETGRLTSLQRATAEDQAQQSRTALG